MDFSKVRNVAARAGRIKEAFAAVSAALPIEEVTRLGDQFAAFQKSAAGRAAKVAYAAWRLRRKPSLLRVVLPYAGVGLAAVGVGATAMYLFDPTHGERRRAELRDALSDGWRRVGTLFGVRASRRGIDYQKTLTVDAPVDEVFAYFDDFENLPRVLSHVRSVKTTGEDRYRFEVDGPGGVKLAWDVEVTKSVPSEILVWRSVEGATIGHGGAVNFESTPDGGTRLDVRVTYNPPGGEIATALFHLLGADPRQAFDDDLARLKTVLERRAPGTRRSRPDLH